MDEELEVLHEEIITHPSFEQTRLGLRGEAQIIITVTVNGKTYHCNKFIQLFFKEEPTKTED